VTLIPIQVIAKSKPKRLGWDYGVPLHALAVGSFSFVEHLHKADILGVAYGFSSHPQIEGPLPEIALVGRHRQNLTAIFKEWNEWAKLTDGDAVELSFVFLRNGGYQLVINPESQRQILRLLGFDAFWQPVAVQASWLKQMDTRQPFLDQLLQHVAYGLGPFLLSAVVYTGIAIAPGPSPEGIEPLPEVQPLLKFEARFIDEDKASTDPWGKQMAAAGLIGESKNKKPKKRKRPHKLPKRPPRLSNSEISSGRQQKLKKLFPVTLARIARSPECQKIVSALYRDGIRLWQIEQAICNLCISLEMTGGQPHFLGISQEQWPSSLTNHLAKRYEFADGQKGALVRILSEQVVEQIILDSEVLLKYVGQRSSPQVRWKDTYQKKLWSPTTRTRQR
jgi:hypothetical protein